MNDWMVTSEERRTISTAEVLQFPQPDANDLRRRTAQKTQVVEIFILRHDRVPLLESE